MSDMDADPELQAIRDRKLRALMQVAGSHPSGAPAAPGRPIDVTDADIDDAVSRYPIAVVDCWAPWCGPCKMMAPVFAQAAQQLEPQVRLVKINSEEEQQLSSQLGIRSIPTLILYKNGEEAARMSGALDLGSLLAWARQHL